MKKSVICILLLCCILIPFSSFAQRGEKNLGILGGYNTKTESAVAGIFFQYRFSSHFRVSPDLQFMIKNHDLSGFQFNGNAHFPFKLDTKFNAYPLVGITYQGWKNTIDSDTSITNNYFGGNFGAGIEYYATPSLKLVVEGKYSLLRKYSNGNFFLGMCYEF